MRRLFGLVLASVLLIVPFGTARADDQDAKSILDKAIKALGGEEKLARAEAFSWKSKGTVSSSGDEREFNSQVTAKGLDHYRREIHFAQFDGLVVVAGDKGWRKGGDNFTELEAGALANERRAVYLQVLPITLVPLKDKAFKCEAGGEEKVGDKPAVILKVTGPDGKDFTLFFDKESGLPVKLVGRVIGFQGQENNLETTFGDYKDFDGIKKATKIEVKRDGEKFQDMDLTEFKVLDKVDADTFAEPK
jgi:hypothetical protein